MHWSPFCLAQALLLAAAAISPAASARGHSAFYNSKTRGLLNARNARRALDSEELANNREAVSLREEAVPKFRFLNENTTKFAVNGSGIPDVNFDVGESYAGSLPISSDPNDTNQLFWWFFPSTNPAASKEIVIWLNGGPGCSSLEGLLQENGPFLWQYGTYRPVPNTWSWNKLSNIVYIEQPVGTGFSVGDVTATDENDIANQFLGFWKNFVDTFSLQGFKIYITGESYAGLYCPYIANAMIEANNTAYNDVAGMMVYDGEISVDDISIAIPAVAFVDYWGGLFPFNDTFNADIHNRSQTCGYSDYLTKYLVYPPVGPQPDSAHLPGRDSHGRLLKQCARLYSDIADAALVVNPCWNIYQVATTCPLLWDVLGFPGTIEYTPPGASIYFDRSDVKKAIHAPQSVKWTSCSESPVFVNDTDLSLPSTMTVLPKVIDATQNVILGHGALDFVLIANGTLLAIQNMTWGGKLGFQSPPLAPLYIPFHHDPVMGSLASSGVMGTVHVERGLTYVGVALSGHMVPQFAPSVAYRNLEYLLGRIPSLTSTVGFTTDADVAQATGPLGRGNAPPGYSSLGNANSTGSFSGSASDTY